MNRDYTIHSYAYYTLKMEKQLVLLPKLFLDPCRLSIPSMPQSVSLLSLTLTIVTINSGDTKLYFLLKTAYFIYINIIIPTKVRRRPKVSQVRVNTAHYLALRF